MADTPFQIPGLGQAKPNEQLPAENFAPDLLAAAASILGEDEVVLGATNGDEQLERRKQLKKQQEEGATKTSASTNQVADGMELDISDTSTLSARPEDEDTNMGGQEAKTTEGQAADVGTSMTNDAPSPDVTHALEAALNGVSSHEPTQSTVNQGGSSTEQQQNAPEGQQEGEQPEWEADSSPYESSSESSSSDSDSDEDEDGGGYQLLGIEETARLLMAADGDVDGDGTGKARGPGAALRTKNEVAEEVIPKPDVTITPGMKIERLGNIEFIVENTIVIKSQTPGEVQVLDSGSVLCREDRTVIGALAEILGNVRSPMYTVGFPTEDEIKELDLAVGMPVYYSVEHAQYVFTQPLKEAKGTDASNLHDEELPPDEMEFSDDEKEAEYKKAQKAKKRGGKARGGRDHSTANGSTPSSNPALGGALNYDDDEDGPYKPLARPPGFGQGGPPSLPLPPKPETGFGPSRGGRGHGHRGAQRGGRGDFRGRNQRGGGHRGGDRRHGSRGSGSGTYQQFGRDGPASPQSGFSNTPPPPPQNPHLPPPPFGAKPPAPVGQWPSPHAPFVPPPVPYSPSAPQVPAAHHQPPTGNFNFNYQAWNQNQGQQYQYPQAAPQHQSPPAQPPAHGAGYGQPFVPPPQAPAWPSPVAAPQAPPAAGAYNPAYFGGYQQAQQTQQGQGQQAQQGQQYWPQHHGAYGQGPSQ